MAVASGGGHWVELLRLSPAFVDCEQVFVTVDSAYRPDARGYRFYVITDSTRQTRLRLLQTAVNLFWIMCKERPDVVISTGAAPGCISLALGKIFRAKTIWLDSIANADRLSLSGSMVGWCADLWLTQWPHLTGENGPQYRGAVL